MWCLNHRHCHQLGKPQVTYWKPRENGPGLHGVAQIQNNLRAKKLLFSMSWNPQSFLSGDLKQWLEGRVGL